VNIIFLQLKVNNTPLAVPVVPFLWAGPFLLIPHKTKTSLCHIFTISQLIDPGPSPHSLPDTRSAAKDGRYL